MFSALLSTVLSLFGCIKYISTARCGLNLASRKNYILAIFLVIAYYFWDYGSIGYFYAVFAEILWLIEVHHNPITTNYDRCLVVSTVIAAAVLHIFAPNVLICLYYYGMVIKNQAMVAPYLVRGL